MFCDCHTTNVPPLPHLYTGGLQVSYMDIYKLTSSTHDWNTWQYNHPNQLNPSLYKWTTRRYTYNFFMYTIKPIHVQLHCIYAKKMWTSKQEKILFMLHNPSIPAMSPNVPFFPSTYLKWPRSCSKRSQTGLKGGSDRSHC